MIGGPLGQFAVDGGTDPLLTAGVALVGYLLLLGTSTWVVEYFLQHWTGTDMAADVEAAVRDTGRLIGKCENVLVLTLVLLGAYTALGLVFAAKSIVRREDMTSRDTSYYLAGTLVNFTYSIVVGVAVLAASAVLTAAS